MFLKSSDIKHDVISRLKKTNVVAVQRLSLGLHRQRPHQSLLPSCENTPEGVGLHPEKEAVFRGFIADKQ